MNRRIFQHRFRSCKEAKCFFKDLMQLKSDKKCKLGIGNIFKHNRKVSVSSSSSCSNSFITTEDWEELKNQFYERNRLQQNYDPRQEEQNQNQQILMDKAIKNQEIELVKMDQEFFTASQANSTKKQSEEKCSGCTDNSKKNGPNEKSYHAQIIAKLVEGKQIHEILVEIMYDDQLSDYFVRQKQIYIEIQDALNTRKQIQQQQQQCMQETLTPPIYSHMIDNSSNNSHGGGIDNASITLIPIYETQRCVQQYNSDSRKHSEKVSQKQQQQKLLQKQQKSEQGRNKKTYIPFKAGKQSLSGQNNPFSNTKKQHRPNQTVIVDKNDQITPKITQQNSARSDQEQFLPKLTLKSDNQSETL